MAQKKFFYLKKKKGKKNYLPEYKTGTNPAPRDSGDNKWKPPVQKKKKNSLSHYVILRTRFLGHNFQQVSAEGEHGTQR